MRWTITETDNKRNFLSTKFLVTDFFITERRSVLMYTAGIGLSREKYYYLGKVRNFGFLFSYLFTSASRKFWTTLSVRNMNFFRASSSHNPRKSWQATLDWERSTFCHSFINLTQLISDIKHM